MARDPSIIRTRDIVALGAALISFFFATQSSPDTSLRLKWYIELDDKIIQPLVTDLDGDGRGEVILLSGKSLFLKVYALSDKKNHVYGDDMPVALESVNQVNVVSGLRFSSGRRAVALGAGYLQPFSAQSRRFQHLVVVREDWTVVLFDHLLNVVWETPVGAHVDRLLGKERSKYELDEVAILVTAQSASRERDSGGMVVVTGRMRRRAAEVSGDGSILSEEDEAMLSKLSFFAIEGATGLLSWEHIGSNKKKESFVQPQHQYRLDPSSMLGGDDWTVFRSSVLAALPHSWEDSSDTRVELAHFSRQHSGGRTHAANRKGGSLGKHGTHGHPSVRLPGLAAVPVEAAQPHQEAEHISAPNVLVAHSEEGVEVVLLRGGGEVLTLALPKGGLYFDVNDDGSPDHLSVIGRRPSSIGPSFVADHLTGVASQPLVAGGRSHSTLPPCSALVLSGVPAREQLFNGSLCDGDGSFHDLLTHPDRVAHSERRRNNRRKGIEVSGALPVVVPRDKSARFAGRILSHHRKRLEGNLRLFDSVFAVSKGVISSYSPEGELNWQRHDAARWGPDSKGWLMRIPSLAGDAAAAELLLVGEDSMMVIGASGDILASAALAQSTRRRPIVGDFDADGAAEVLLVTDNAVWGYTIAFAPGGSGVFRLFVLMLAALSTISYLFHLEVSDQKRVMRLPRSTD